MQELPGRDRFLLSRRAKEKLFLLMLLTANTPNFSTFLLFFKQPDVSPRKSQKFCYSLWPWLQSWHGKNKKHDVWVWMFHFSSCHVFCTASVLTTCQSPLLACGDTSLLTLQMNCINLSQQARRDLRCTSLQIWHTTPCICISCGHSQMAGVSRYLVGWITEKMK